MHEAIDLLKLFGGFVYLLMGGDMLVRGALGLARETNISPMVVGLTVVAMGTSAPELMVSAFSALSGYPGIAIGNVVGSNIANVLLVIGVPVFIHPILCNQAGLGKQAGLMIAVSVFFILLCVFQPITFWSGALLVTVLIGFLISATRGSSLMPGLDDAEEELERVLGLPSYPATITFAGSWGISESVIGLSLIALGTSLPELSTTVIAAMHKNSDVAIGNVIGSNLFNILAILGLTAMMVDIPVEASFLRFDLWVMLGASVVLWLFVLLKAPIGKLAGGFFLAGYAGYLYLIF